MKQIFNYLGRPPDVNQPPNFLDFDDLKSIKIPKTKHKIKGCIEKIIKTVIY